MAEILAASDNLGGGDSLTSSSEIAAIKETTADPYAHTNDALLIPPEGRVDLAHKARPVHVAAAEAAAGGGGGGGGPIPGAPWAFTRAALDVSGFRAFLLAQGEEIWDDDYQARHNVGLTRPAHDNWGIRKVVFVFCDDYLKRVYELPWFHRPEWRQHLDPIFQGIGLRPEKLVRCLLASIPPGVTIPPHHDTGHWVRFTHRVHVAVATHEDVVFRCGPDESNMARVSFDEGRVVELNNQSKHYVHNGWDQYRTHLIFDYVEDFPLERVQLQPGEALTQTRRTVDRAAEAGARPVPSYLIIGAQKAGTTSLYEHLCQHALVLRARRREAHYFDWRWNGKLKNTRQHREFYEKFFHKETLDLHPSLMTGESTPSYLLNFPIVLPRLLRVLPHRPKILVTLRDPVKRAFSHYQMTQDPEGSPAQKEARGQSDFQGQSFEQVVRAEIAELARLGITPGSAPLDFAERYLKEGGRLELRHGGHSFVGRGLYALQLAPWLGEFELGRELMVLRLEDARGPGGVQAQMDQVCAFLGLPPEEMQDTSAKNTRSYGSMSAEIEDILYEFYEPFNQNLYKLLGRDFEWGKGRRKKEEKEQAQN